jgi:hypothetical protein
MKNLNGLHMSANSQMISVAWTADDGRRYHVWLETEKVPGATYDSPNHGYRPLRPFQTRDKLYQNPATRPDGTHLSRYDEGYFPTRYLNPSAKANAPVIAEALRRAEAEGMFEAAVEQAMQDEADREAREQASRVARMREDLGKRREFMAARPAVVALIDTLLAADDADLYQLANI